MMMLNRYRRSEWVRLFVVGVLSGLWSLSSAQDNPAQLGTASLVYVSPLPGSSLVSRETNIILRARATIEQATLPEYSPVAATGTVSGPHSGRFLVSDDRQTMIFVPFVPFAPSEDVTVTLRPGIQTSDGRAIAPLPFRFSTSSVSASDRIAVARSLPRFDGPSGPSFSRSSSAGGRILAPESDSTISGFPTTVPVRSIDPSAGSIFFSTLKLETVNGVVDVVTSPEECIAIVDNSGRTRFSRTVTGISTDFKVQPNGYLTYYDGGTGLFFELDSTFSVVDTFSCGNGYPTDVHELRILPNGHTLLLGLDPETVNMSTVVPGGNPAADVIGMVVQELDQARNVVFQWRTFDHFQITDATYLDLTTPTVDYVHTNAIDVDSAGNIIISSRHFDEITKIDRQTGNIIWRWGGKNNQFTFVNDSIGFSHQHCIRLTPAGTYILFDDGNYHAPQFSRAVEYKLDEQAKTATMVWQFRHNPDLYAFAMGSVQRMPNGNTLIGWGMATGAAATEVRPDGTVEFELTLPDSLVSYRALRFPWSPAGSITSVSEQPQVPSSFELAQNYPNPFNPSTVVQYSLPRQSSVALKVYDIIGREITTLSEGVEQAGTHKVRFDASHLASGVYFYRLTADGIALTKAMTLMK